MAVSLLPVHIFLVFGLVLELVFLASAQRELPRPGTIGRQEGDIDQAYIRLVNGTSANEGRVLIRWFPDAPWTTVCFEPFFSHAVPFQMCRRLGYPFACGQDYAGTSRTDDASLVNVRSVSYLVQCAVDANDRTAGGCNLVLPDVGPTCSHDRDMWLSCGYADMPDFELRLDEGAYRLTGLLQGRCGPDHEWTAICNHGFHYLREGSVACRELGYSDRAVDVQYLAPETLDPRHRPSYTLFVDIGCAGNESSLTECQFYSLRDCTGYFTLECFTDVREYGETAYLCGSKQLCGDTCMQSHPIADSKDVKFHYCQCDNVCSLFDDCCYDYEDMCPQGVPRLEIGGFTIQDFGCEWLPGSRFTNIGYVVVNRCPISWTDAGTRDLCEQPVDDNDVIGSMPVYDEDGVDFKNVYCAICNGRPLDGLKRWSVAAADNRQNPSNPHVFGSLNATLPTLGWVVTPPTGHLAVRTCKAHLIDTCLEAFRGSRLEAACKAYYAPIKSRMILFYTRYRNPHCAMCNGENVEPQHSCNDMACTEFCVPEPWGPCHGFCPPVDGFLTIEVLFDFKSTSSIYGKSCSKGQIYDPFLEKCRVLSCAAGFIISGNECVPVSYVPPPDTNGTLTSLAECLVDGSGLKSPIEFHTRTDASSETLSVSVLVNSAQDAEHVELAFDDVIEKVEPALSKESLPCNISTLSVHIPFSYNGSKICNAFKSKGNQILPNYQGSLLTFVKFSYIANAHNFSKEKVPSLCLEISELNCSALLTLDANEYTALSEVSIYVPAIDANMTSEFVLLPDMKAVVCSFIGPAEPEGVEPQTRRVLSYIGTVVSLIALAATFATYCVFSELRNDAGIATMNLVAALFTAMLMFFLSGLFSQNQAACQFGAVVAHFTWLAAFTWMAMLATNVAKTVVSMVPRRGRKPTLSRTLVAYTCISWGVPLVIVIICLIIHVCDCPKIPPIYAEDGICWITNITTKVVAFVVPMSLCLGYILILFVFTVISIRRNRHGTQAVRKQSQADTAKEELSIYAKLCALVGVTWISGFISQSLTGILVFSYIYIILNYLQGVFIFIAFCLNKRVRNLWREKFERRQRLAKKAMLDHSKETASVTANTNESTHDTKL